MQEAMAFNIPVDIFFDASNVSSFLIEAKVLTMNLLLNLTTKSMRKRMIETVSVACLFH